MSRGAFSCGIDKNNKGHIISLYERFKRGKIKYMINKLFNCEVWKDFYDENWRIKVLFMRWEIARFKLDAISRKIERVKDGWY